MNPGPGTSWPDLHYLETEQVQLDVAAIIARGTWLRRKRLISKAAVIAVAVAIGPAAVVMDMGLIVRTAPMAGTAHRSVRSKDPIAGLNGRDNGVYGVQANPVRPLPPEYSGHATAKQAGNPLAGIFSGDLSNGPAQAVTHQPTTLARRYGPMLAIAGARAGSGVWFAATAAELTLFHLSVNGALKSWVLPAPARSLPAGANIGLTVTAAGVAWLGVASTLMRLDTRSARFSTWQMSASPAEATAPHPAAPHPAASARQPIRAPARRPAWSGYSAADSLAVSPDGHVAIATPLAGSVQVLNPRDGKFRQIKLPASADYALAVGYANNGTLGIGFEHSGRRPTAGVLLVRPSGAELSRRVKQPTSVIAYGATGLLVGVSELEVVSARGLVQPLVLPADTDLGAARTPPAMLPGNRLGIALDTAILTFPATATSVPVASAQSELWFPSPPRCRPHRACPAGYRLAAADATGDMWLVPAADRRTVELVNLR